MTQLFKDFRTQTRSKEFSQNSVTLEWNQQQLLGLETLLLHLMRWCGHLWYMYSCFNIIIKLSYPILVVLLACIGSVECRLSPDIRNRYLETQKSKGEKLYVLIGFLFRKT